MPLFRCRTCDCVDNTALARAWDSWYRKGEPEVPQCTECRFGTWHGEFPKEPASATYEHKGKTYRYVPDECGGTMPGRIDAVEVLPPSPEVLPPSPEEVAAKNKRERRARRYVK